MHYKKAFERRFVPQNHVVGINPQSVISSGKRLKTLLFKRKLD